MTHGEAWDVAAAAVKNGDLAKAREMLPMLYPTDRALMVDRIAAKEAENEQR